MYLLQYTSDITYMKKKLFRLVENNTFRVNRSLPTYDTTITVEDPETGEEREVDVTVEYEYTPAERGSRERGTGLQLEPDYEATVEISAVYDETGKEYDLTDRQQRQIEDAIFDDLQGRADDYDIDDYRDEH
jgi:hypothetical protein